MNRTKPPGEDKKDDVVPAKASAAVATAVMEDEDLPLDEEAQRELDEARKADEAAKPVEVLEPEDEEVAALRQAFQRVQDKITWHEGQIEEQQKQILVHEAAIDQLKANLRTRFDGLVGDISGASAPVKRGPGRPRKDGQPSKGGRPRKTYGGGNSTGDLIATFLQKAGKAVDADTISKHLASHGNDTNPSVELSRMVKKELVRRPSRGMYEWVGPLTLAAADVPAPAATEAAETPAS